MTRYYSINGKLVPVEAAVLGVTDLAIQRGYGLFDFFLVKKGQPLFFEDYLDRLERSAALMRLELPFSREEIKQQIMQLIRANGEHGAGMKLILTGGYSPDGYAPAQPNLLILQSPLPVYPASKYERGVKLMLYEYHRSLPSAKSINYLIGVHLLPEMQAAGAEDILFHANGNIYETTRANFFMVKKNNTLVTPGSEVLMGITRLKTVEIAKQNYPLEERELKLAELETAQEAFLTSSTKGIMPVVQVGDTLIGDGRPGKVTKHLAQLLEAEVERYLGQ
jgi:branched-subunit amino acid aminotransferase/4-amino-4-deoxychorismate lyase